MTAIPPARKKIAIKGTTFSVTLAIRPMPPKIIRPHSTASTIPVTLGGTAALSCKAPAMEFACVMFPIPKEAKMQKMQKKTDSHFWCKPFSM